MSNHKLAELLTYDPSSLTDVGWRITLYSDGSVSFQFRTRWQGGRDETRYRSGPGYVDVESIDETDPDKDSESVLTFISRDVDPETDPEFRMTRRGYVVR